MEDDSQVSALDQRDADTTEGMESLLYRLPIVNWVQFIEVFCKKYFEKLFSNFYSARNARIASAVLATAIPSVRPSVCLSVTCRYCVKTTARSTVQFAPLDSKMCLVL